MEDVVGAMTGALDVPRGGGGMSASTTTAPADEPELDDDGAGAPGALLAAPRRRLEHLDRPDPARADRRLQPARLRARSSTVANARNIATDAAVLLVLATGMTYVIITAGIDLSVGAVLVFSGVVAAKAMHAAGGNNWGVILLGLVVALAGGMAWGLDQRLPGREGEDPRRSSSPSARWAWPRLGPA